LVFKTGVGIVGSRRPTSYGVSVTENFTRDFVENGLTIISGMALGIDSIAHRTCLNSNGKTIAVLGSGVDLPTPSEHFGLYSQIIKNGGAVVSEFPLGMIPNKGSFPARNRIISALSSAILIPAATSDSGALITAKEAFAQNRKVFVVPGPITSNLSKGTNNLLSKGGIAVGSAHDVIQELGIKNHELRDNLRKFDGLKLTKEEKKIYKAVENESLEIDKIVRITKIPVGKLMVILTGLELRSILKNNGGKWEIEI
jgi:DNA processing protein